jgi:hypothetical protein
MFESGQRVDYEALSQMVARRQELIHRLLRDRSLPYRILTFVPGSRSGGSSYRRVVSSKARSWASVALPDSSRKMSLSSRFELKGGSR